MNNTHETIPVKPPVEEIEAMIEASLANKNNVEAVYKAVIDHFVNIDMQFAADAEENKIMKMAVGTGTFSQYRIPFVTVTAYYGPHMTPAIGYLTPDTADGLGKDLVVTAAMVKGRT